MFKTRQKEKGCETRRQQAANPNNPQTETGNGSVIELRVAPERN